MNETHLDHHERPKVSVIYWIVAGIGFLWNLMGAYNFYAEYNFWTKPETRSVLDPEFGPLYDATPGWLYILFAIAVLTGLVGTIGLLLRKKWAVPALLISLVTVFIQMGYNLFGTELIEVLGTVAAVMPLVVVGFALLLYFYAKRSLGRGWLS